MARTLDIVVKRKTRRKFFYTLFADGKAEEWRIPSNNTFDHMALKDGQHYRVDTKNVFTRNLQAEIPARTNEEGVRLGNGKPLSRRP